jgi:hypothetical protein
MGAAPAGDDHSHLTVIARHFETKPVQGFFDFKCRVVVHARKNSSAEQRVEP